MDLHPWTKYELARLRDEDRLRASRAALHVLAARRRTQNAREAAAPTDAHSLRDRIRRRQQDAVTGPSPGNEVA
jgi:hypothetical protein